MSTRRTSVKGMMLTMWAILRRPRVGWLLRLVFSIGMLALLFIRVDVTSVLAHLTVARPQPFLAALALYFAGFALWAYRMSLALRPLRIECSIPRLFVVILISTFYSLVLPGNALVGGAVAWYKLTRSNRRRAEVAALLVYVRLIDTIVLLAIGLAGVWFDPHFSSLGFKAVIGVLSAAILAVSLPFFFPPVMRIVERLAQSLMHRLALPRSVQATAGAVWEALRAFQLLDRSTVAAIFGLSLAAHVLGIALFYLLALAIDMEVSAVVLGWIRSLVGIIQLVPFSLAGLGVREVSIVLLLREYGIAEAQALTFSLAVFSMTVAGGLAGAVLEARDTLFRKHRPEGAAVEAGPDAGTPP